MSAHNTISITPSDQDEFETKIEHTVQRCLDEKLRKLMISVWTMIIGGVTSLVVVGIQWGSLVATVKDNSKQDDKHHSDTALHMSTDRKFETFVTRTEWAVILRERERDYDELKVQLDKLNDKIDKLAETLTRGGG